jgi:hypothetical protein
MRGLVVDNMHGRKQANYLNVLYNQKEENAMFEYLNNAKTECSKNIKQSRVIRYR